ncbi:putative trancriptional regulator, ArsR family [Halapricum desulfuricans]|uniref:Putative trancriptional regulator, ArsR family n=1 Tax=Halapricum desulfuricans TaxID=2841257 RepID=A0A897N9L2_9EURY|nr:putative trancriptional regulator, ArsR family [Halapricum desulfuricans]
MVFQVLGSRRRRYVLHYLRQQDRPVPIRELSEQLSAWELGKESDAVTPKERKRLYTALHQTHLPTMDRSDIVEYDRNRGVVSLTDYANEFDIYLDIVPHNDLPWGHFYLALGAVLTTLVAVAALGIPPFTVLDGFDYALAVAGLFTLVAAYHTLRDRRLLLGSTDVPAGALPPQSDDSDVTTTDD